MRKSGWDSSLKDDGVAGWRYKFLATVLIQLFALSGVESATASGTVDAGNWFFESAISETQLGDFKLAKLGTQALNADQTKPKLDMGFDGILDGGVGGEELIKLRLAEQTAGDKPAAAAGGQATGSQGSLSRMEPLRLRRGKAEKQRTILSPWIRVLMRRFRWGGTLFDQYSTSFGENRSTVSSNSVGASINASSSTYIWKPWFMVVGGGLGTTGSWSQSTGGSGTSSGQTGSALMSVFPSSRFPFTATYDRRKTGSESELSETVLGTESITLNQKYSTRKKSQYVLSYRRTTTSADSAVSGIFEESTQRDSLERLNLDMLGGLSNHDLRLHGGIERYYDVNTTDESKRSNVLLSDRFVTSKGVSINSLASHNQTEQLTKLVEGGESQSIGKFTQFASNASYSAKQGKLLLHGGVRASRQNDETRTTDSDGFSDEKDTTRANGIARLGFRYRINRNASASGSADAATEFETESPTSQFNQSLNLSYGGDPLEMGKFLYRWRSSGGVANTLSTTGESTSTNGRISHTLARPLYSSKATTLSTNFSQNYSLLAPLRDTTGSAQDATQSFSNSASVGGSNRKGRTSTTLRLSVSDTRSGKGFEDFEGPASQVVNISAVLQSRLSPVESLSGSLSSQYSNIQDPGKPDESSSSSSGSVSYRNSALYDIRGLSFTSTFRISDGEMIPTTGSIEEQRLSWENRLIFNTGRLRVSALVSWEESAGVGSGVALIRLTRSFGSRR